MAVVQPSDRQLWGYILWTHHKNPNIVLGEIKRFKVITMDIYLYNTAPILYLNDGYGERRVVKYKDVIQLNEFNLLYEWLRAYVYECTYELHSDIVTEYYITNKDLDSYIEELIMHARAWIELNRFVDENYIINWRFAYDAIIMGAHITFTSLLRASTLLDDDRVKILDKIPAAWKALA